MKIGILIPTTSKDHENETIYQSLLSKTIKSFSNTSNKEHEYVFYIGIDNEDTVYDNKNNQDALEKLVELCLGKNSIKFIYMNGIKPGHLTAMWNRLAIMAYNEKCHFLYQCGDDIEYKTHGWINKCIYYLSINNYIGVTGPFNMSTILTQTFVSRKHIDIFGYYFPEEITNWFCDDWINEVYKNCNCIFYIGNYIAINMGGVPRYEPKSDIRKLCDELVIRDVGKLRKVISK